MSFVTTWMDLEGIMLSKISKTNTAWCRLYVESKTGKKKKPIKLIEIASKKVVARGCGWEQGYRERLVKRYKL